MKQELHLVFLLGIATSLMALAGNATGGGGGDLPDPASESAWFTGNARINYCFEIDKNFGISVTDLQATVENAFQKWVGYFDSKQINNKRPEALKLSTNRQYLGTCDGTENLKFYFGVKNASIEEEIKHHSNPISFAKGLSYDPAKGSGKGYIWVVNSKTITKEFPDWEKPHDLLLTLIHEIGHIYGVRHIDGTIMTEAIANNLMISNGGLYSFYDELASNLIDGRQELVLCGHSCQITYRGHFSEGKKVFQALTGRAQNGHVQAEVDVRDGNFVLYLSDKSGTEDIRFTYEPILSPNIVFLGTPFFAYRKTTEDPDGIETAEESLMVVSHVRLIGKDGKQYPAQIYRNTNTGYGPLAIHFIIDNEEKQIFAMGKPSEGNQRQ